MNAQTKHPHRLLLAAFLALTVLQANAATPPTISCPAGITEECTGGLTPVSYTVTAVDSSGGSLPVTCMPPSGTGFRLGTSNVVCSAMDAGGNSSSCSFTVRIVDTTQPQIFCSTNVTAVSTNGTNAFVVYTASTTDACGLSRFDCKPPGGNFPVGITTVRCDSADLSGNSNSCTFSIQVTSPEPPNCVLHESSAVCGTVLGTDGNPSVISLNGVDACVVLDGSDSTDPNGDPLSFAWIVDGKIPVTLDAEQEPAGTGGTGSGTGFVTLSGNTLIIDLSFSGLSANSIASHIHGPAARGVNAAVLYALSPISTLGGTEGTIQGTVTLVEGMGGFTIAQQIQQFREGRWYVNIHTTLHPGGEIRGQLDTPTLTGPVATTCLERGCHTVTLTVSDGRQTCAQTVNICVVSACEAVQQCISLVDAAAIPQQSKKSLLASLNAACASFDRGNYNAGVNQLQAFEAKVRSQIGRSYPAVAQSLYACAGQIIDSVDCVVSLHGNNGVGNGVDPQPPGNPPVNDGPGAGPGNPGHKP